MIVDLRRVSGRKIDHPLAKEEKNHKAPYSKRDDYSYICELKTIEDFEDLVKSFSTFPDTHDEGLIVDYTAGTYTITVYDGYIE